MREKHWKHTHYIIGDELNKLKPVCKVKFYFGKKQKKNKNNK